MKFFVFLGIFLLMFSCSTKNQMMKYTKANIATLSSKELNGRGYTHQGIQKAEAFLIQEFKKINLIPVYPNYQQKVEFGVNVIVNSRFAVNGEEWIYGEDYLLNPNAETIDIPRLMAYDISHSMLKNDMEVEKDLFRKLAVEKGNVPVLDMYKSSDSIKTLMQNFTQYLDQEKNIYDIPFLVQRVEKLTQGMADAQDNFVILQTTKEIEPNSILELKIKSEFIPDFESHNLVGKIKGTKSDSAIFITAHYDHLGQINDQFFPGANDNASGVSMLLNLAHHFKKNPPKNDLYFYAFTGEEVGLKGSIFAAENLPIPKEKIKFLINLDIMGTGDDGIQVVNSTVFKKEFELLNSINQEKKLVKQIKTRGESCNSDHCPFYQMGIPSFFIYTLGGVSYYHDINDRAETLPLTDYYDIYTLLTLFINQL